MLSSLAFVVTILAVTVTSAWSTPTPQSITYEAFGYTPVACMISTGSGSFSEGICANVDEGASFRFNLPQDDCNVQFFSESGCTGNHTTVAGVSSSNCIVPTYRTTPPIILQIPADHEARSVVVNCS
jgi:hypothetical protein